MLLLCQIMARLKFLPVVKQISWYMVLMGNMLGLLSVTMISITTGYH